MEIPIPDKSLTIHQTPGSGADMYNLLSITMAGVRQGRARNTHVSDVRRGQGKLPELLSGCNRAHIGVIGLDLKCLKEFDHIGNEVKNCILLKVHYVE